MTYCSNYFKRSWQCDPDGNDFQDKLGRLLTGGKDLKASMRASALASVGHMAEFEKQHAERAPGSTPPPLNLAFYQQTSGSRQATPPASAEEKGYVWVDGKGSFIDTLSPRRTDRPMLPLLPAEQPRAQSAPSTLTRSQALYMNMSPTERSCYSWRKINPGCMEITLKPPSSSMKDHFKFDAAKVEPVNRRNHMKKTEFSEYTETKARVMHHIS